MKPQFHQTVDILVKAYLNGTLNKGLCTACAVGNIVAAHRGTMPLKSTMPAIIWRGENSLMLRFDNSMYADGSYADWWDSLDKYRYAGDGISYDEIGYTMREINLIEKAFESQNKGSQDEQEFEGLMAVVDVLAEIHGIDLTTRQEAKLLFAKP